MVCGVIVMTKKDFVFIPEWMKSQPVDKIVTGFDLLIDRSPAYITEGIFVTEFLPLFAAPADQITNEIRENYIARYINYAIQPYNPIDVYERLDEHGRGINLLFTVPPLWNSNAPILKEDASKAPVFDGKVNTKYDSSIFRTLVARINLLITAGDAVQVRRYRDALLPHMAAEAPTIDMEHIRQWHIIHQRYGIKNELSEAINRLLGDSNDKLGNTKSSGTSDISFSDEDDDF